MGAGARRLGPLRQRRRLVSTGLHKARACWVELNFKPWKDQVMTGTRVRVEAAEPRVLNQKGPEEEGKKDRDSNERPRGSLWTGQRRSEAASEDLGMPGGDEIRLVKNIEQPSLDSGGTSVRSPSSGHPGAIRWISGHLPQWPDVEYLAHFLQHHIFNQEGANQVVCPQTLSN